MPEAVYQSLFGVRAREEHAVPLRRGKPPEGAPHHVRALRKRATFEVPAVHEDREGCVSVEVLKVQ